MQRISREASRVSNAFCLFASPILLRSKRSGIHRRRSGSTHIRCNGDNSVFDGDKGSCRKCRLGFLSVNNASSALVGDCNGLGFRCSAVISRRCSARPSLLLALGEGSTRGTTPQPGRVIRTSLAHPLLEPAIRQETQRDFLEYDRQRAASRRAEFSRATRSMASRWSFLNFSPIGSARFSSSAG